MRRPALAKVVVRSGGLLLPRVVLQYARSDAVVEGRAEPRDFLLGDLNLGKAFVAHVGPWRPHAIRLRGRALDAESFDPSSLTYQAIEEEARQRRRGEERRARVGVEFLLWLPRARKLALFEFANRASGNARTAQARASELALFTTELVGVSGWFVPVCQDPPAGRFRALPTRRWALALDQFTHHRPETTGAP